MKNLKTWTILLLVSALSGCGYRWQSESPVGVQPTISVNFVDGDEDGRLTSEIIRTLSSSGICQVVPHGGDYQLKVKVNGLSDETTGYRVEGQKVDGKLRRSIFAIEGRRLMNIEATIYANETIAFGPFVINSDSEYDFVDGDSFKDLTFTNPLGVIETVLPFSLGQLASKESAQTASTAQLYTQIANKIVDLISNEW